MEGGGLFPGGVCEVGGLGLGLGGGCRGDGHCGLFFHEGVHQEADAEEHERDGEELSHIEGHIGLEVNLVVLHEFNEEAASEAHN